MERDKQHDRAIIDSIIAKAEKLAENYEHFEAKQPAGDDAEKAQ
jgi:hypothetical protein